MPASLESIHSETLALMAEIGRAARKAAHAVAQAPAAAKNRALRAAAAEIRAQSAAILAANAVDVEEAREDGATVAASRSARRSTRARLEAVARGRRGDRRTARSGRPRAGDLRAAERPAASSASRRRSASSASSTRAGRMSPPTPARCASRPATPPFCAAARKACAPRARSTAASSRGLRPPGCRRRRSRSSRRATAPPSAPCSPGSTAIIDVIVPRGGKSLVARVQHEARVPVFAHLEGIVHVFVHAKADLDMAKTIVLNAKMRRTGICGAAETLLVDNACAATHLAPLVETLLDAGCEVRGDAATQASTRASRRRATKIGARNISTRSSRRAWSTGSTPPWSTSPSYGSHHTDCIVTSDEAGRRAFPERGGFGHRRAQRLDAIRRWRRVRLWRRDRHRHGQDACARPGRRGATDLIQISRAWERTNEALKVSGVPGPPRSGQNEWLTGDQRTSKGADQMITWAKFHITPDQERMFHVLRVKANPGVNAISESVIYDMAGLDGKSAALLTFISVAIAGLIFSLGLVDGRAPDARLIRGGYSSFLPCSSTQPGSIYDAYTRLGRRASRRSPTETTSKEFVLRSFRDEEANIVSRWPSARRASFF